MGFSFINSYRDRSDFEFEVGREKMHLSNGNYTGVDALYREDTGTFLSVVSPSYKVVSHKDANNFAEELFQHAGLEFEEGNVAVDKKGAKFLKEFRFPSMKFAGTEESTALDYEGRSDEHIPSVILRNSYDKSSALDFRFGAFRIVCSNGSLIGETTQQVRYRHTIEPDFDKIKVDLIRGLEVTIENFKSMYSLLNGEHAQPYMNALIKQGFISNIMVEIMRTMIPKHMGHVEFDEDTNSVVNIETSPQLSAYALMQVITEIITHRSRKYTRAVQAQQQLAKVFTPADL